VTIEEDPAGLAVSIRGVDTINLGKAGSVQTIQGQLTISNPAAVTHLSLDDSADPVGQAVTVTDTSLTGLTPLAINYDSTGVNSLDVKGNGHTTLILDDSADQRQETYTIKAKSVTRLTTPGGGTMTYNYTGMTSLGVTGGTGVHTFNVESLSAQTSVSAGRGSMVVSVSPTAHNLSNIPFALTVNGNRSDTTLTLNDQADEGTRTYTIDTGRVTRSQAASVSYNGLSKLTVYGAAGTNTFNVESTAVPTFINSGSGTNNVYVSPTAHNLDGITNLTVDGGRGSLSLTVYDQLNPNVAARGAARPATYTLDAGSVTRRADYFGIVDTHPGIQSRIATINYSNTHDLTVYTGNNGNIVNVLGTSAPMTIHAGVGRDTITVGNGTSGPGLDGQVGQLTVDALNGKLILDDRGTQDLVFDPEMVTNSVAFTITDGTVSRTNHVQIVDFPPDLSDLPIALRSRIHPPHRPTVTNFTHNATIQYSNLALLEITGGMVDTTFNLEKTTSRTPVMINAGADGNQFKVGANGSVKDIRSSVKLSGIGTHTSLVLDDANATSRDQVTVTPADVGANAADQFFGSGGSLSYSGISALTLNLSKAFDDTVRLTPSTSTAFSINGGLPAFQAGHGATLTLDQTGVTNAVNTPTTPGSGQWTFGNRQAVTYTHMAVPLADVTTQLAISLGSIMYDPQKHQYTQTVTLQNTSTRPIVGPLSLVLDSLGSNVKLVNQTGVTQSQTPAGSSYIDVALANNILDVGQSVKVTLIFEAPSSAAITYRGRVLAGSGAR
jgi:hypothetical protein